MTWFIQSTSLDLWDVIEDGPHIPSKLENGVMVPKLKHEWDELDRKKLAKEIWKLLEVTYEGNDQVKESKINILMHDYELFSIKDFEYIVEMFSRFIVIVNELESLGKTYTKVEKVMKILRSLPRKWETKVTAIQEAKDLTKLSLEELIGSLMTYEIELYNHQRVEENEKSIAFMAITNDDEEEESESESDEGSMQKGVYAYLGKNTLTILVTVSLLKLNFQLVSFLLTLGAYIEGKLFSNLGFVIIKKGEIVKSRQDDFQSGNHKYKSSQGEIMKKKTTSKRRLVEGGQKFSLSSSDLLFPVKVEPQPVEVRLRPNGHFS
ncbi:hypothetical protein AAG906_018350 [Vitis piasezkii]